MTENARARGPGSFQKGVSACMAELDAMMPELTRRYDFRTIVGAMAEQVGGALQALRRGKVNTDLQTRQAIERIEKQVFGPRPVQPKAEDPPEGGRDPSRE